MVIVLNIYQTSLFTNGVIKSLTMTLFERFAVLTCPLPSFTSSCVAAQRIHQVPFVVRPSPNFPMEKEIIDDMGAPEGPCNTRACLGYALVLGAAH